MINKQQLSMINLHQLPNWLANVPTVDSPSNYETDTGKSSMIPPLTQDGDTPVPRDVFPPCDFGLRGPYTLPLIA